MSKWHGGKGDKNRTANYEAYTSNYDKIFNKQKTMRAELKDDVYRDDYECPDAVDLLEGDVIEWWTALHAPDCVEITIVKECYSVGEASGRGDSVFTVPTEVFNTKYKPAFK